MKQGKLRQTIESVKTRPALLWGAGLVLLLFLSAFRVYHIRVIYSPSWLGQGTGTAVLFAALAALCAAFALLARLRKRDLALFLSGLLLVLGIVWSFATPPNQVPDEQTHFLRSHAMAQGQWGFDEGHIYPDDVNSFIAHFPQAHNNGYPAKVGNTMANRFAEYRRAVESDEKAENISIIIFQVIPYIPSAAGIALARVFGADALAAFWCARIANVLFFVICAYFALRMAGRFAVLLFMLIGMPLSCFVWASVSSDSFLMALTALMFACVLSDSFDRKKLAVFVVSFALLSTCKMSYVVFILLLLCVSKERWKVARGDRRMNRLTALAVAAAALILVYGGMSLYVRAFSNYGYIPRTMDGTSMSGQLAFILSNPLRYLAVFRDTLKNNSFFLFSGGVLGWLDVSLPLINYTTPFLALAVCMDQSGKMREDDGRRTAVFALCSVLTYRVVMTGLYLSWTPVSLPQIIGLQMRYFIPAFMGFYLAAAMFFRSRRREGLETGDVRCAAAIFAFNILAAAMMLRVYYIPLINKVAVMP